MKYALDLLSADCPEHRNGSKLDYRSRVRSRHSSRVGASDAMSRFDGDGQPRDWRLAGACRRVRPRRRTGCACCFTRRENVLIRSDLSSLPSNTNHSISATA